MFAVSDHGVSRVDQLTVTLATVSVPSGPTSLTVTPGNTSATWATAAGATSYSIYRGTASGAEGATAVGTATSTSFTDSEHIALRRGRRIQAYVQVDGIARADREGAADGQRVGTCGWADLADHHVLAVQL